MSSSPDHARCLDCPLESGDPAGQGQCAPGQGVVAFLRSFRRGSCAFSGWAYLLGPLYYLARGMWRKALSISLLWAACFAVAFFSGLFFPAFADGEAQFYQALLDVYAGTGLVLTGLGFLFPLLIGKGQELGALVVALLAALVLLGGELSLPRLELGPFSAFCWFAAFPVWSALGASLFLCVLTRRYVHACGFGLLAFIVYLAGLPIPESFWFDALPRLLAVFCGVAAPRDLCRSRLLRQRFWW